MAEYVGCTISLISTSEVRYVGILHAIDSIQSSVSLSRVVCCGTEGRMGNPALEFAGDPSQVFEFIQFKGADVKDLQVIEVGASRAPPPPPMSSAPAFQSQQSQQQQPPIGPTSIPQRYPQAPGGPAAMAPGPFGAQHAVPPPPGMGNASAFGGFQEGLGGNPYGGAFGAPGSGYSTYPYGGGAGGGMMFGDYGGAWGPASQAMGGYHYPAPDPFALPQQPSGFGPPGPPAAPAPAPAPVTPAPAPVPPAPAAHSPAQSDGPKAQPPSPSLPQPPSQLKQQPPRQPKEQPRPKSLTPVAERIISFGSLVSGATASPAATSSIGDTAPPAPAPSKVASKSGKASKQGGQVPAGTAPSKAASGAVPPPAVAPLVKLSAAEVVRKDKAAPAIATQASAAGVVRGRQPQQPQQPSFQPQQARSSGPRRVGGLKWTGAQGEDGFVPSSPHRTTSPQRRQQQQQQAHQDLKSPATSATALGNALNPAAISATTTNAPAPRPKPAKFTIPTDDFDFASSNAKFVKSEMRYQEGGGEGATPDQAPPHSIVYYNRSGGFFDNISCNAKEKLEM